MTRLELMNILNQVIPTYSIGQLKGKLNKNCAILRRSAYLTSMSNSLAGWDNWYIDIYSPFGPGELDKISEQILTALQTKYNNIEIENKTSGDYWDTYLQAYVSTMSVRCPNTTRYR